MFLDTKSGLITPIYYIPSPNFNERPDNIDVDLLVIHGISLPPGVYGTNGVTQLFTNRLDVDEHECYQEIADLKVSSHLFIRRDGLLYQYVPLHKRAWHAGESEFEGRNNCNDYSIGIELEGVDDQNYTDEQYKKLAEVSKLLIESYPGITIDRIVGHSDVAPGRKTDPGPAFDWALFMKLLD